LPGCLKEGRYLSPVMGAMDRGWRGDHNALGLSLIRWMEGKICTIYYFWYATRGVHCGTSYNNILTALMRLVDCYVIGCVGSNIHADSSVLCIISMYWIRRYRESSTRYWHRQSVFLNNQ
jgi:hypothetical protein